MPIGTQARLLRVLESGEFIRVGSSKPQKTDVRVVAATNVNLPDFISRGKFREDLYYRLNTVPISVPALRERPDDIYLLFRKFAVDFAERYRMPTVVLDQDARKMLENYPWPGNVRELKNIAEQVSVLASDKQVHAKDIERFLPENGKRNLPVLAGDPNAAGINEREILYKVLFGMRKDLNELKRFVWQLASSDNSENSNLRMPAHLLPEEVISQFGSGHHSVASSFSTQGSGVNAMGSSPYGQGNANPAPRSGSEDSGHSDESSSSAIVIEASSRSEENAVEESLSIAEKEKELIEKALAKHKGKRKDAALDLGISERTLYRKIKEYEINE